MLPSETTLHISYLTEISERCVRTTKNNLKHLWFYESQIMMSKEVAVWHIVCPAIWAVGLAFTWPWNITVLVSNIKLSRLKIKTHITFMYLTQKFVLSFPVILEIWTENMWRNQMVIGSNWFYVIATGITLKY